MRAVLPLLAVLALAACSDSGLNESAGGVYAPGPAGESDVDGLMVGHRLMAAGEYELALRAYTRAAAQQGLTIDTLSALGSANLRLGRLGQAERLMRRAVETDPTYPAAWNNLGVILMEQEKFAEASEMFRRAYATDNGNSDQIRNNLRAALAIVENQGYTGEQEDEQFQLIRRGAGDYVILSTL